MARRKRRSTGLMGLSAHKTQSIKHTAIQGALSIGSALIGAGIGAAIGRPSFLLGLPVIFLGVHKKSMPLMALGMGVSVSFVPTVGSGATSGLSGFDSEAAKVRVKFLFENFKDKLYLPKSSPMGELGEPVAYFVNPYNRGVGDLASNLDLRELDNIQSQIAEMSNYPLQGLSEPEIEREF